MNDLSISQSYLICALNKSGKLPALGIERSVCLVAGGLIEAPNMVDHVIQNIRAELLERGTVSDNIVALASLMDKSNQIKQYFSKYEKDELTARLKEIRESGSNKLITEMVDYINNMIAILTVTCTS